MNKELAIDMLAAVKKPARYTGGEFGSIFKEERSGVPRCV